MRSRSFFKCLCDATHYSASRFLAFLFDTVWQVYHDTDLIAIYLDDLDAQEQHRLTELGIDTDFRTLLALKPNPVHIAARHTGICGSDYWSDPKAQDRFGNQTVTDVADEHLRSVLDQHIKRYMKEAHIYIPSVAWFDGMSVDLLRDIGTVSLLTFVTSGHVLHAAKCYYPASSLREGGFMLALEAARARGCVLNLFAFVLIKGVIKFQFFEGIK